MAITDLPQMVAAFHSLVGLAAVNTSIASYMMHPGGDMVHSVATLLGTFIGAITLTGGWCNRQHLGWLLRVPLSGCCMPLMLLSAVMCCPVLLLCHRACVLVHALHHRPTD